MTNPDSELADTSVINRREAIKRTAMILGVALSPSIVAGVLQAQTAARTSPAKPVYLSPKQFETAGAIAERILPRTDTPGAIDVGVPAFVDLMYGKYMTEPEKKTLTAGFAEVETASTTAHKKAFSQLAGAQQDELLKRIAQSSQAKDKSFFHQMKELTLLGYFSSEPIGKKVLHYDPVPGAYQGCIPLSDVGNVSWTR